MSTEELKLKEVDRVCDCWHALLVSHSYANTGQPGKGYIWLKVGSRTTVSGLIGRCDVCGCAVW